MQVSVVYLHMAASKIDAEKIKQELKSDLVVKCAARHNTVGDPSAMKVCYLLRHYPNMSVTEIAGLVGLSVSATSRCLAKLKAAEIVTSSKVAQTVHYQLQTNDFTNQLVTQLEP